MSNIRQPNGEAGFTLLELLIAVLLLTIGFLGTFTSIWASQKAGSSSRNITQAATLGQDLMEQLLFRNYTGLRNGTYSYATTPPYPSSFSRSYTVQQDVPATNMKTVTVTVSWKEFNLTKTRTLTSVRRADF
ncbi:prepilin-type N-terminal cleavage/methylation domain-containing protein [Geomonas sp. Red32]|uniref:type IV pilus modification PilV family protein n=1 Tax=Geomonas sp. Red32 TaxID=2912856 RepID=UPI00202CA9AB|nr:prepilin-type N-terminal cleavage/methylation domain-containing protein [Geomonas sp. Red32]